jgi:hypothetical protein
MNDIVERLATARNMIELERAASDAIDEIERLRGLLREAFDGGMSSAWYVRTKEALGDVPVRD